ncbi:MAG: putative thioesterase [Candidatus Angelobacter sp. Gp1-AA117]|nr:MAG: putative thioesterase [Candidatus Angelobacter sp. Gp1-AA117]
MPTQGNWISPRTLNARAAIRLFCCPYAGGSEAVFRAWQTALGPAINVVPLQLPGRGVRMREPLFRDIMPLVASASEVVASHLDKPFALFGHSMGATISFELARALRKTRGVQPIHLFVSGTCCPQEVGRHYREELPVTDIKDKLRQYAGTPPEVLEHPELMEIFAPIIQADFAVCRSYQYTPEPPLGCPITAFGGLEDHDVSRESLQCWGTETTGQFRSRMLPGGHFFINDTGPTILETIARDLQPHARV